MGRPKLTYDFKDIEFKGLGFCDGIAIAEINCQPYTTTATLISVLVTKKKIEAKDSFLCDHERKSLIASIEEEYDEYLRFDPEKEEPEAYQDR